jgi:membrane protein DedA with SNARE-associated domain
MFFSVAGAICWALAIGYIGLAFGSSWHRLVRTVARIDRLVLIVVAGCAAVLVPIYWWRRRKSA